MRPLWSGIIQPTLLPCIEMTRNGLLVDEPVRLAMQQAAWEEREHSKGLVQVIAAQYASNITPSPPAIPACSAHQDYQGATPRRKCPVCTEIYRLMKEWRGSKAVKKAERLKDFNPFSKEQVAWLLFEQMGLPILDRTDSGRPAVTLAVIEELAESEETPESAIPLLTSLKNLAHIQKRLTVDLKPPIGEDGRVHPPYTVEGTAVGRLRSGVERYDPDKLGDVSFNGQNIPESVRRIYRAADGFCFIELDAAQIEWVLMMLLARCQRGISAYAAKQDIHTDNTRIFAELLKWDILTKSKLKERRRWTKRFTHGVDYGEGPFNLARRSKIDFGEAKSAIATYLNAWPEIREWQKAVHQEALETRALRNPFGRIRRFLDVTSQVQKGEKRLVLNSKAYKEALAFGPASTNADLWKINLRKLWERGWRLATGTHDSYLMEVPEMDAAQIMHEALQICESEVPELEEFAGAPWKPRFDAKVGRNWGPYDHQHNPDGMMEISR